MCRLRFLFLIIAVVLNSSFGSSQATTPEMRHGKTTVISLRCLSGGQRCITASYDGTIVMWELGSGKRLWQHDLDAQSKSSTTETISNILGMDLSRDGSTCAVSYRRNHVVGGTLKGRTEYGITLLDAGTGQFSRIISGHTELIGQVAFSADGDLLLSESGDRTARLWNVKSGEEVLRIALKEKGAAVAFCGSGKLVSVATQPIWGLPPQSIVALYDVRTGRLMREFPRVKNVVTSLAFTPDGRALAIASGDAYGAEVDVWDMNSEGGPTVFQMSGREAKTLAFSNDGRFLAIGGYGNGHGIVEIRDIRSSGNVRSVRFDSSVTALDFLADGSHLVVGTDDGHVAIAFSDAQHGGQLAAMVSSFVPEMAARPGS